jgi:hypothetical protein
VSDYIGIEYRPNIQQNGQYVLLIRIRAEKKQYASNSKGSAKRGVYS